jgi:hypothetical protein
MTDPRFTSDELTALDADLAVRRAHRDAASLARALGDRLHEVDIHQREARFVLERAGKLSRRSARGDRRPPRP